MEAKNIKITLDGSLCNDNMAEGIGYSVFLAYFGLVYMGITTAWKSLNELGGIVKESKERKIYMLHHTRSLRPSVLVSLNNERGAKR